MKSIKTYLGIVNSINQEAGDCLVDFIDSESPGQDFVSSVVKISDIMQGFQTLKQGSLIVWDLYEDDEGLNVISMFSVGPSILANSVRESISMQYQQSIVSAQLTAATLKAGRPLSNMHHPISYENN